MALFPIRLMTIAAAGLALGAGWKAGTCLVELVTGDRKVDWSKFGDLVKQDEPLWKRKFTKVSED